MQTMDTFDLKRTTWQIALSAVVAGFAVFMFKLVKMRMIFYKLKKQGLVCRATSSKHASSRALTQCDSKPMPPWDFAAGNLKVLPALLEKFPKGSQQLDAFALLSRDFNDSDNCFYIDLWPFTSPLLVVTSPELAMQACQEHDLPKPAILKPFFAPFAGGPNLFDMNGAEWKRSRALFNPCFSASIMLESTPHIIEEAEVYVALLREHAKKGDTFSLDRLTCDYMMDLIGAITM
jgi:cytochrome P450